MAARPGVVGTPFSAPKPVQRGPLPRVERAPNDPTSVDTQVGSTVESLYRRDLARLVGLAEWIVGSRMVAEELVHDVFARIVDRPPKLDDPDALAGYVRSAVVNRCRSKLRRRGLERKHRRSQEGRLSEVAEDPIRVDEHIRSAVLELPTRQRQVVALRFYEDLKVDQIADTLGVSAGTVKTHLHRALDALSTTLAERGEP